MSAISRIQGAYETNRSRTIGVLDSIEQLSDAPAVLGWRPPDGLPHVAWQLMHIGINEDVFATELLAPDKTGRFTELWHRFREDYILDDDVPTGQLIRQVLSESREVLLDTLSRINDDHLDTYLVQLRARTAIFRDALSVIYRHEVHHQGQAGNTLSLYQTTH